jgi:hypothetical protein
MLGFLRIIIAIMLIWIICLYEIHIWISFSLRFVFAYYSTSAFVFSKPYSAQWRESITNFLLWSNFWLEVVLCCWCSRFICFVHELLQDKYNLVQSSHFLSRLCNRVPKYESKVWASVIFHGPHSILFLRQVHFQKITEC